MKRKRRVSYSEKIAGELRGRVRTMKAGDRLPTEAELAGEFEVGISTVREAVLLLVQEGLLEKKQGSGTYVLDARWERHVAILCDLDLSHSRTSAYYTKLSYSLRDNFVAGGCRARVYVGSIQSGTDAPPFACPEFLRELASGSVKGAVAVQAVRGEWLDLVKRRNIPLVGCSPVFERCVSWQFEDVLRDQIIGLAKAGRKKFAFLGWGAPAAGDLHFVQREDRLGAFRQVLSDLHLTYRPEWTCASLHPSIPGAGYEEFRDIWMAADEKPDALVITDEHFLMDVILTMSELGIKGGTDLEIIAHWSGTRPLFSPVPLTVIEQDPVRLAAEISREMLACLETTAPPPRTILISPRVFRHLPATSVTPVTPAAPAAPAASAAPATHDAPLVLPA